MILVEKEESSGDGKEPEATAEGVKVETAQTEVVPNSTNKNEVLNQVTAKFTNDVSKVWGSALSFGKDVYSKVKIFKCILWSKEKICKRILLSKVKICKCILWSKETIKYTFSRGRKNFTCIRLGNPE